MVLVPPNLHTDLLSVTLTIIISIITQCSLTLKPVEFHRQITFLPEDSTYVTRFSKHRRGRDSHEGRTCVSGTVLCSLCYSRNRSEFVQCYALCATCFTVPLSVILVNNRSDSHACFTNQIIPRTCHPDVIKVHHSGYWDIS